jgi:hypothetical protein
MNQPLVMFLQYVRAVGGHVRTCVTGPLWTVARAAVSTVLQLVSCSTVTVMSPYY